LTDVVASCVGELATLGRPAAVIDSQLFYRDASVRLEYGRTDVESFYSSWLDAAGLQREVLAPLGPGGDGRYLPSLRDPLTNRSTRAQRLALPERGAAIVVGELLLGGHWGDRPLDFELTVHFAVSRQSRRRQYEERYPDWGWTLPAFDRYDLDVDPALVADVLVRFDDPRHPALAINRAERR
jgi:hypothetical protein